MPREVTIRDKESQVVQLGLLRDTGRRYHHIQFIDGATIGQTRPSASMTRVPIADVEVIEGYRYDLVAQYVDRNKTALLWQSERQQAIVVIKLEAEEKKERAVEAAIKRWEREHPVTATEPTTIADITIDLTDDLTDDTIDLPEFPRFDADDYLLDNAQDDTMPPQTYTVGGAQWGVGTLVVVKDTWESGVISKIDPVAGTDDEYDVWVSVHAGPDGPGNFPVRFSADRLEGPGPGEV